MNSIIMKGLNSNKFEGDQSEGLKVWEMANDLGIDKGLQKEDFIALVDNLDKEDSLAWRLVA